MTGIALVPVGGDGPVLGRAWTVAHVTAFQAAALAPPLVAAVLLQGPGVVEMLVVALIVALGWEAAFARLRHRALSFHGITTAAIFAIMAPAGAETWQAALAVSFGAVVGEQVFGGRGFGFVNAGLAALAFLLFSFPALALDPGDARLAYATIPGAALLLWLGLISWRVLAATAIGLVLAVLASGGWGVAADMTGFAVVLAFPLVFLVADPLAAAATNPGRWAYGLVVGALVVLFQPGASAVPTAGAVLFAGLVGAIFAPLLDEIAIRVRAAWSPRHG